MNRFFLLALALVALIPALRADEPFRLHRYDSFRGTPVTEKSIVFLGNSITNMHEWREAFGNHPDIVNRGNSGGFAYEYLNHVEDVIAGHPAKVFIGIGTNDITQHSPEVVASDIRKLVDRFLTESPRTEVYVQSLLPSTSGVRNISNLSATNALVKANCEAQGVTFIDLFDKMMAITTDDDTSYDKLHITSKGYTVWCNEIAKYVGAECTYPAIGSVTYSRGAFAHNSNGMRATQWAVNELKATDILIIGDEMIHGGEWHELLNNPNVKNRGVGWGYGGIVITDWTNTMATIFTDNAAGRKTAPAKVFLYVGCVPAYNNTDFSVIINNYSALINKIKELAPTTEINILSLIPRGNTSDNETRTLPLNDRLKALCQSPGFEDVNYVDIYTPLAINGGAEADPACITGNYLYGRGYHRVAKVLAPLTGSTVMSDEAWENNYELVGLRQSVASIIYNTSSTAPDFTAAANKARRLLAGSPTIAELQGVIAELNAAILPAGGSERYYSIRDQRSSRYVSENDANTLVTATTDNSAAAQWQLIARADGSFDIINNATGNYITNTADYNSALTTSADAPASGWQLKPSAQDGALIIVNGSVQFNTTTSAHDFEVYNWGSGTNTTDTGCQYYFAEVEPITPPAPVEPGEDSSNPVLTLTDVDLTSAPFRIPDAQAAPILAHNGDQTLAIEFTKTANNGKRQILASVGRDTDEGDYFAVFVDDTKGGVIYVLPDGQEGWFTKANNLSEGRHKLVVVMTQADQNYRFYVDNNNPVEFNTLGNASWGFSNFGNVEGSEAIFLGGTRRSDIDTRAGKTPLSGEIHSARFYNRALSADEVSRLSWTDLTPSAIDAIAIDGEAPAPALRGTFDLQGRRVDGPLAPGLYIIDGHKTFVR